jgi:hypothetical protein
MIAALLLFDINASIAAIKAGSESESQSRMGEAA